MAKITVTPAEFQAALAVWVTVAPSHIFTQLENGRERFKQKRGPDPLPAFRQALANHCREKLEQAGWEISRSDRGNIFSGASAGPATPR